MKKSQLISLIGCCLVTIVTVHGSHIYEERNKLLMNVSAENCLNLNPMVKIELERGTVSHLPRSVPYDEVQPKNRTDLQYAHNIAANRALFFSMIYNWTGSFGEFNQQPGLNYIYMSTAANILAGPDDVLTSGLYFLTNRSYPNWLSSVRFNQTLPLFGASATREKGANQVDIRDLGLMSGSNYSNRFEYKQNNFFRGVDRNPYFNDYTMYTVHRHLSDGDRQDVLFSGVDDTMYSPMAKAYMPTYDCGATNQWLVTLASEVVELLPRYSSWTHLRSTVPSAVNILGVSYKDININPCPISIGNPMPNYFVGMASCPVECKPVIPNSCTEEPYQCCDTEGCSIEHRTTSEERARGESILAAASQYNCSSRPPPSLRQLDQEFWDLNDIKAVFEVQGRTGLRLAHFLSNFLQNNDPSDNERNAQYMRERWEEHMDDLRRLSNSLPLNRQNEIDWNSYPRIDSPMRLIKVDHALTRKWIEAEVSSTVLADGQILSAGIFLEPGVFNGSQTYVSASVWRGTTATSINVADLYELGEDFSTETWYTSARQKFANPATSGTEYSYTSTVRVLISNAMVVAHVPGQVQYTSVRYEDGDWLTPYYLCNQRQSDWATSYTAPIFVKNSLGSVVFGGVVKVDAYFTANHLYTRN